MLTDSTTPALFPANVPIVTPAIPPRPTPAEPVERIRKRLAASTNAADQATLFVLGIELLRKRQQQGGRR